ncbi:MAG: sterol desaturase family protein [Bacteroidetes bacterium]|nr:sterol desaturase family protein [Bacteroidota bacterium]
MLEKFVYFWDNITTVQRLLTVLAPLLFFWLLEYLLPLFTFDKPYEKVKHTGVNLVFLATSFVVNLILGIATVGVSLWVTKAEFGIMNWTAMPLWLKIVLTLFVMDLFAQYIPHYLMHKVKPLWRFHVVHHSDTHVDVSTGTRHHPGEWIVRESFTILGVVLMGVPVGLYYMQRSFQALFTYFNHANIQLPKWLDKAIALVFVSPDMHKIHHHHKRPWTDMNFANIFSVWDRIFGTLVYDDTSKIRYGIDTLDDALDENVAFQLKVPFNRNIEVSIPLEENKK